MSGTLAMDDIDKEIMRLLMENPEITHEEIAAKVHRSQPAVGARILKLRRAAVLSSQYGINFKSSGFPLALVTFNAPISLIPYLESVPYLVQVLKTTGSTNFMALVAAKNMQELDTIVETFLRSKPGVTDVNFNFITRSLRDLIIPFAMPEIEPTVEAVTPHLEAVPIATIIAQRPLRRESVFETHSIG